ncbi:hypothetical protein PPERSA_09839 [Pseudocohnilembus persalinus]|uniref:Uncharacterized protein n=1 Tax=Pseudocohnilembus persalinus TaxID=266149 RepID=A0A0V0QTH9_PSEPJ|nr:hypothetical protein PPERSA_09839 [Pseudocohnilembus persalinus]|eukprot:KRX05699.1 hypothetical protein PPERSA_09839 [Pseudocohnilembus persalinus]
MAGGSYATYLSFKLGPQLPIACRHFGQQIGMGYNYFKVILRVMKPSEEEPGEIMDLLRKTDQQSKAFNREMRETIYRAKQDIKEEIPEEFTKNNPLKNLFAFKADEPIKEDNNNASGSDIMQNVYLEKKRIVEKKRNKNQDSSFYNV